MNTRRLIALLAACALLQACAVMNGGADEGVSDEAAAVANLNLGVEYLRQGRPEVALNALERALEQNPRLADVHSTIALAYDQLGNAELAEQHYRRAIQLESSNAAAQNSYAVFLCRQNRWGDAERYFRQAIDNSNYATPAVAAANAGTCARAANDIEKSEQYFRLALNHDPVFADALAAMTELSYQSENYLQARAFIQRLSSVRPADARSLWLCFHIETELNDQGTADGCVARLRNEFPESAELDQINRLERDTG